MFVMKLFVECFPKLWRRVPSIVVQPTDGGQVESGELRWPPDDISSDVISSDVTEGHAQDADGGNREDDRLPEETREQTPTEENPDPEPPSGPDTSCRTSEDLNPERPDTPSSAPDPVSKPPSSGESSEDEEEVKGGPEEGKTSILPSSVLDRASAIAHSCSGPSETFSPVDLNPASPRGNRRDSTLSQQDQMLIGKIRNYYENQDLSFKLQRRESLNYIPAGLVRTSVSRLNSTTDQQPNTESGPLTDQQTSTESAPPTDTLRVSSDSLGSISLQDEVFRPSSEMIQVWQAMEEEIHRSTAKDLSPEESTRPGPCQTSAGTQTGGLKTLKLLGGPRGYSQRIRTTKPEVWRRGLESRICEDQEMPNAGLGGPQVDRTRPVTPSSMVLSPAPPTEIFPWPDVRQLRSKYCDQVRPPPEDQRPEAGLRRRSSLAEETTSSRKPLQRARSLDPRSLNTRSLDPRSLDPRSLDPPLSVEPQTDRGSNGGFFVAAEAPLPHDPEHRILVLEKGGDDSLVQSRSPTSREKISIMAVIDRCRVYQESEEGKDRVNQNQNPGSDLVRNLRARFQSLSEGT
ncbi:Pleckstrin like domain containing family G member 3 [Dissostichus eleginoides]|uniref:Pleckstrin like domain containing family G member 3 n=1 Tax=Dissostichus eleginoides TaxID=100907 RepID=A0AAD9EQQ7_DISEL|nr:Pleckstrin like domain containing family G member 3 [Dissostichus eleginoides]